MIMIILTDIRLFFKIRDVNKKKLDLLQNQKEAYKNYMKTSQQNEKRLKTMIIAYSLLVILLRIPENFQNFFVDTEWNYRICSFVICSSIVEFFDFFTVSSGMVQFFLFFLYNNVFKENTHDYFKKFFALCFKNSNS